MENDPIHALIKQKIAHYKKKADHNKRESLWSFKIIMLSTVIVPILIAYGHNELWSKVLPSIFSCISAFLTAWLHLRKPNQLWTLYRTVQRELESELELYQYSAGPYKEKDAKDTLVVERVNEIYLSTNTSWSSLIPNQKDVESFTK